MQEVNGWNEKGYSKVKVVYDDNATADLKKSLSKNGSEHKITFTVDGAEPKSIDFNVNSKDFNKKMYWMQEYVDSYASTQPPVVAESFISRTLDNANKARIFEDLAKRQAIYEEENGLYDTMNNSSCRERYAFYCLQKIIGYAGSKSLEEREVVTPRNTFSRDFPNDPFYQALGEIGPDGIRDLILQEHLRWNVTYLAEGVEFGPFKSLYGVHNAPKTSPWIVSAEELWERSQQREVIPMLDKEGVDYIAYTEDAIAVRKSMNYDLDGFADLCQDSRKVLNRSFSSFARGDKAETSTPSFSFFYSNLIKMNDDLKASYARGDEGLKRMRELESQIKNLEVQKKELEVSSKDQKISTPSL